MLIVSETNASYTAGADLALVPVGGFSTAAGVVTPPSGSTKLQFMVRLKTDAIMYLRSQSANGAVLSGATITANQWTSFECAWTAGRTFSVRFSASQSNLYDLVVNAVAEGL